MRLRRVTRALLAAVAIVQMAVPVLAVVADAQIILDSAGAPQVHIEEHTQKGCHRFHPDDCPLCQLLTHFSAPRGSAPTVPVAAAARCPAREDASPLPASIARAQQRTRAPPVSLS
ncbi:MAG TPA: DUF2946 family protein [Gemmatimonadaceae bacterium]|jgi:hypothetical protein